MKKSLLYGLCAIMLLVGASGAGSSTIDISLVGGTTITYDQAIFIGFTEAIQTSVSSGTGEMDPFLTIQEDTHERGFNSDAFPANDYVYLYTQFGSLDHSGFPSQAGFEEYALREQGTSVSEPATMLLLGFGLVGLAGLGRKKLTR